MFESLSDRLGKIFEGLTGRGALSTADVDAALREVRRALLEADVSLEVVKAFVEQVRERAVGAEVTRSSSHLLDRSSEASASRSLGPVVPNAGSLEASTFLTMPESSSSSPNTDAPPLAASFRLPPAPFRRVRRAR